MSANENYHLEVIKDFERALEESDDYDVIIKAGDEKEVRAHSSILRARSSYFKRALSSDWEEKDDNGKFIFKKPNISSEVFHLIFRYLYTGIIDIDQCNKNIVSQLLIACDELGLCKLIEHIQGYISEKKGYLQENPVGTLESIYKVETFQNIKDECLEIICEDPRILFTSENPTTDKSIITMILQSDDLNMEEIEIWESLLRWIFIRHLKIDKESMWTSESSEVSTEIKQIIQEYIPLIRFYDISKEDFFLKVYPYRNFLPQDLLNDVLRYHMVPNSIPTVNFKPPRNPRTCFNSVFVSKRLFRLFAKWIDKRSEDYATKDVPYKFNLLLRGTRDGFESTMFHQLCDSKGATISIARVIGSKQIIGGYNPLNWYQNGQYANTWDSFLFNITDSNDLNSAKIGRVFQSPQNAIYNHSSYGPTFGGGNDLRGQGNTWNASNGNTYTNIRIPANFTIDEYEVFQVVKKS